MQPDASPEGASIQTSLHSKNQPEQQQTCQQAEHWKHTLIEACVRQAEDRSLADDRRSGTTECIEFTPEPAAEHQFLRQSQPQKEQQRVQRIGCGELPEPTSPGAQQQGKADQCQQTR